MERAGVLEQRQTGCLGFKTPSQGRSVRPQVVSHKPSVVHNPLHHLTCRKFILGDVCEDKTIGHLRVTCCILKMLINYM